MAMFGIGMMSGEARHWPCSVRYEVLERNEPMKVRNSLKSLRARHRDNRIVRRKGRVYIINTTNRRFKARQG